MAALTSSEAVSGANSVHSDLPEPPHRYGAVLSLVLTVVVFLIAAPAGNWSLAIAIAIQGAALVITVATSRSRETVRRRRAVGVAVVLGATVLLTGTGVLPRGVVALIALFLSAAVPAALVRGLLRLMREQGVTRSALAGSLAIYLSIGLIFAWLIGFAATVNNGRYFSQQTTSTQGDKVYFSFTSLTTTGYGDFTPANPAGHAIAVIEMLVGQIYLVTVIGLLIGSYAGRRSQHGPSPP